MVGHFGWVGTPYAFDVVTRLVKKLIRMGIDGPAEMATDDLVVCSHESSAPKDMEVALEPIHMVFVADCINNDKTEVVKSIAVIGWEINLLNRTVGIARHNLLKTLHGFMTIKSGQYISIRHFMRLASWASRYSTICRYMKPFTHYLYSMSYGMKNPDSAKRVSMPIYQILRLWVMFLTLTNLFSDSFTRSLTSFAPQTESLVRNIDASLEGIGFLLYRVEGTSRSLIAVVGYRTPYDLNIDSSYQNTMEFIAMVSTIFLCIHLGFRDTGIKLESDSISSISWTSKESFRSERALAAACVYIPLMINSGLFITEAVHIPGTNMVYSDPLSRGHSPENLGFSSDVIVDLSRVPLFLKLINMVNPVRCAGSFDDDDDHIQNRWTSAMSSVREFLPSRLPTGTRNHDSQSFDLGLG